MSERSLTRVRIGCVFFQAEPSRTLRAVAEGIMAAKAGNVDLCAELDVFCKSKGRAVEASTFAKFSRAHRVDALRTWCSGGDGAFYELCDALGLSDGEGPRAFACLRLYQWSPWGHVWVQPVVRGVFEVVSWLRVCSGRAP